MVEQAGIPIDRVFGGLIDRKGLFYLLTLESVGFVSSENEDFDALPFLVAILPYPSRMSPVRGRYGTKRTNIKIWSLYPDPLNHGARVARDMLFGRFLERSCKVYDC